MDNFEKNIFEAILKLTESFECDENCFKKIMKTIRKVSAKMAKEMPGYSSKYWKQEAFVIFFEQCRNYDPEKGKSFKNFMCERIKWGLIDEQRRIITEKKRFTRISNRKNGLKDESIENFPKTEENKIFATGFAKGKNCFHTEAKAGISPEDQYIRQEMRQILWKCIDKLSPEFQNLFIRHFICEKTQTEIAEKLGKPRETLSKHARKARTQVSKCVEKNISSI